jgi:hypothetical protein
MISLQITHAPVVLPVLSLSYRQVIRVRAVYGEIALPQTVLRRPAAGLVGTLLPSTQSTLRAASGMRQDRIPPPQPHA